MLAPWLAAFPRTVQPLTEYADHILRLPDSRSLSRIIADGPNAALSTVENAQPAILITSIAILRVLEEEFGFKVRDGGEDAGRSSNKSTNGDTSLHAQAKGRVDFALGHSLGEFSALVAAGYISFGDAVLLVRKRAELMAQCSREARATSGDVGMVALVCESEEHLAALFNSITLFLEWSPASSTSAATSSSSTSSRSSSAAEDDDHATKVPYVSIANINSKTQLVLSGSIPRIATLLAHLRQFGGHDPRHVRINTECPFHSPFMAPAVSAMRRILEEPSPITGQSILLADENPASHPPTSSSHSPPSTISTSANGTSKNKSFIPCISNITARPFPTHSRTQTRDLLARSCASTVAWWASVQYLDRDKGVRRWVGIGPGKVGRNLVGKEVGIRATGGCEKAGGKRTGESGSGSDKSSIPLRGGGVWAVTHPREVEQFLREFEACEGKDE